MKKYAIVGVILLAILAAGVTLAWTDSTVEAVVPAEASNAAPATDLAVGVESEAQALVNGAINDASGSTCGQNFVDEDGDGICDLMGTGAGNGPRGPFTYGYAEGGCGENFVDEDGDGICDLMGTGVSTGAGNGPNGSRAYGYSEGSWGTGFVDEDGDGVCDLMGTGAGGGQGLGQQGRMNGNSQGGGRGGNGAGR